MFYRMITQKRNEWLQSKDCAIKDLIAYMEKTGAMRDAQIDAIKTYLFLKIKCNNMPLAALFYNGAFNNLNIDELELSNSTREYIKANPASAALYEYTTQKDKSGNLVSSKLEVAIRKNPDKIDYKAVFNSIFYGITYTDYLFSLPMGAGKTYLMAAFIYLDLYFANNEPTNPAFAHNFIIFAPSGLKSSVVPSLKTIQRFDPKWIIPEPAASNIKRQLIFEVLDENKTAKKSNKVKNPNVQKIANHQPFDSLFGLVAVTNAEKVILNRIQEKNGQISFFEESDDDKDRQANELRNLLGKLPFLSIFIDEVHHAVSDEIKLRAVVNKWTETSKINSVIGFSGTPYLEKSEKIIISPSLSVANAEINNVVYYYPLIDGIGNFLKRPTVKISDVGDSSKIIDAGVREFLNDYKDTVYEGDLTAKLGIYCGSIEKLEKVVFPLVSSVLGEYGLGNDIVLKFHKGNKTYPQPADSQLQFDSLDTGLSKIKIILLVQIGKEGWDCKSLTGIILSQEGDCPTNMVLQTSCRCLREVKKNTLETALIYLNKSNAEKLNTQLQQQQHISLKEFVSADNHKIKIERYDRTAYLKLPKVDFYQLKINYDIVVIDDDKDTNKELKNSTNGTEIKNIVETTDLTMEIKKREFLDAETGNISTTFNSWIYGIAKSSFGFIPLRQLKDKQGILKQIFDCVTYQKDGVTYFSSHYDIKTVEENIRKAFYESRDFTTVEELIPEESSLLSINNFTMEVETSDSSIYYPKQETVKKIIADDSGKLKLNKTQLQMLELAKVSGNEEMIKLIESQISSCPNKDRTYHYLPYKTDSGFEQVFLKEVLTFAEIEKYGLEVYYNGDDTLTEFKIKCYKSDGDKWRYVGMYTPDFLIIQRKDGKIYKAIIVETKGNIYANIPTFKDKRSFMETQFIKQNNDKFGYKRFDYLYLEDTLPEKDRLLQTYAKIKKFFEEKI